MNCHDAQATLHAYLDRELDPSLCLEYERHLGECPACGKALAEQQAMQTAMHDEALYFKAPAHLAERLRSALRPPRARRLPGGLRWVAAAACLVLGTGLGFVAGRFTSTPSTQERLTQEVASAHIRSLQAEHLVDVRSSDQHTVKPWFNGKLDFAPPMPDLASAGFSLVGGRIDYLGGRQVAALVYRRRDHFINVFVCPDPSAESREVQQDSLQGYQLFSWSSAGMTYWVISDLNRTELGELVQRFRG